LVGVGALSIMIGVWVAPSVLLLVTVVLVETCSWFGRRIRALGRGRAAGMWATFDADELGPRVPD
jgi:hypothetical protein